MTEASERHKNNVLEALDKIERKAREIDDLEFLNVKTGQIAGMVDSHISVLGNYGIYDILDREYESLEYERYYGITVDLNKYREEREEKQRESIDSQEIE